jgi:hypothetical protein
MRCAPLQFLRAAVVSCVLLGAAGCEGPTAPVRIPGPLRTSLGEKNVGAIAAGDSVEYRMFLSAGFTHRLAMRAFSGSRADSLVVTVTDTVSGTILAQLRVPGQQPQLFESSMLVERPAESRDVKIVVRGVRASDDAEFEFRLDPPLTSPEHVTDSIILGDTVTGEWFDGGEDVDSFRFRASAGQEIVVYLGFAEILSYVRGGAVMLSVSIGSTNLVSDFFDVDPEPAEPRVYTMVAPADGQYTLQLRGLALWQGRYAIFLRTRDRAPETAPVTFAIGDTVSERMDDIADVDEFRFTAAAGDELMFNVATSESWRDSLTFLVYTASDTALRYAITAATSLDDPGLPMWSVPASGEYRVRVVAPYRRTRVESTGDYRFEFYRVNRAPELVNAVIPFGGTMTGETIERRGDIDEFVIAIDSGTTLAGNPVVVMGSRGGRLLTVLSAPSGAEVTKWEQTGAPGVRDSVIVSSQYGARVQTLESGAHRLRIRGDSVGGHTYGFRTYRIDPSTESRSRTVTIGSWIEGEGLDVEGDLDEFEVMLDSGRTYALELEAAGQPAGSVALTAFGFRQSLGSSIGIVSGDTGRSRLIADATGMQPIRVNASTFVPSIVGAYRFRVLQTNLAPETTDSVLAIGESVEGESIGEFGDVDHFYVTASSTDSLRLVMELVPLSQPGFTLFAVPTEVQTGTPACQCIWTSNGFVQHDWRPQLPGVHTYRISVREGGGTSRSAVGGYRLRLERIP